MGADPALEKEVEKVLKVHGIGDGAPPAKPELWEQLRRSRATESTKLTVENRFYTGYSHSTLDGSRDVHAIFADFKADGMQMGMLLERLEAANCQYVFVGNPLPFNEGWHFTAVNDFEHKPEQERLDPAWRDRRVWHRVGYIPTLAKSGAPAVVPRESYNPEDKAAGAIEVTATFRFKFIHLVGGLMPHTLNAVLFADGSPASLVLEEHFKLGQTTFAAIGHGLDALLALGTKERSRLEGFKAAVWPGNGRLLEINGVTRHPEPVCACGGLVTASHWGTDTASKWFEHVGLGHAAPPAGGSKPPSSREHTRTVDEPVFTLDVAKLPGMAGATFSTDSGPPRVAVFVDHVTDPIEIFVTVTHLIEQGLSFQLISHSGEGDAEFQGRLRRVASETVFGNAMYGLRDCQVVMQTTPANLVPAGTTFSGFVTVGGQCPYYMIHDPAIIALMNAAKVAAAVCHGPEVLVGTKWLHPPDGQPAPRFTSYYGCWMSFRDVIASYVKMKPGEVCQDETGRLITGNAPNSTKELVARACSAIKGLG